MQEDKTIIGWLIEDYSDDDYIASWEMMPIFETMVNRHKNVLRLNQNRTPFEYSCTTFWTMAMVAYNSWVSITKEDVDKCAQDALDAWYVIHGIGWPFNANVNFVRKWIRKHKWEEMVYWRFSLNSARFQEIAKERAIDVWYYTSNDLHKDIQQDGIVQWVHYPRRFWHLVHTYNDTLHYIDKHEQQYYHNSYHGVHKYNQFYIKRFEELKDNKFFMPFWYIMIARSELEQNTRFQQDVADVKEAYRLEITYNYEEVEDIVKWNYTQDNKTTLKIMRQRRIDWK